MLRRKAKNALVELTLKLPSGFRTSLFQRLMREETVSYEEFLETARRFNVSGLSVRGAYGEFHSTSSDAMVLMLYALRGTYASETNSLLREFFSKSGRGTYIDIGANIGLTTVPLAQDPNVLCIAIEPEPTNFRNLVRNVADNCSHGNVTTLQKAVSFQKATLELELDPANLGDHRIRTTLEPGSQLEHTRQAIEVEALPLDDLVGPIEGPLAIKMDVQGAEPFVVAGGENTLNQASLVIMEYWPYGMKRMGADFQSILEFLEPRFEVTYLSREGQTMVEGIDSSRALADLRDMAESKVSDPEFYVDIVARREIH